MEQILKDHERLEKKSNLQKPISHIQEVIDKLKEAKNAINTDNATTSVNLAKAQNSVKNLFEKLTDDIKDINSGLSGYGKSLNKKFKEQPPTFADHDILSSQPSLINRAIAMHLLREGHFDVATRFISEANENPPPAPLPETSGSEQNQDHSADRMNGVTTGHVGRQRQEDGQQQTPNKAWEADFSPTAYKSANLQRQFAEMYHILHELSQKENLGPAIEWAREHSDVLEARGSNLEYDLCRLQYIALFNSPQHPPYGGPLAAIAYARETFPKFPQRYASQTHALLGALAFAPNIHNSPYSPLFSRAFVPSSPRAVHITPTIDDPPASVNPSDTTSAAAAAFTSEFCALLSLSSASPLLTAVTAGCIALPTLLKLSQIQAQHRTSWTTAAELPVEVPLPPSYQFHSVFVCPVSKEQSTDANPPMLMPCGHLVARESLERLSRGARFKCPYCPQESHPRDAKMVFLCVLKADLPRSSIGFGPRLWKHLGMLEKWRKQETEEERRKTPPREDKWCCLDFAETGLHGPFCPVRYEIMVGFRGRLMQIFTQPR